MTERGRNKRHVKVRTEEIKKEGIDRQTGERVGNDNNYGGMRGCGCVGGWMDKSFKEWVKKYGNKLFFLFSILFLHNYSKINTHGFPDSLIHVND